jgi:hypothetical protein
MTQEVLKLALDALETELSIDWANNDEFNASAEKMYKAIAAIKEALAQPEQWGASAVTHPEYVAEQKRKTEELRSRLTQTWVGLPEERIKEIWLKGKDHGDDWTDVLALARSFEAELKGLNT